MSLSTPVAIYMLTNTLNNKVYIGQSVNPERRMQRHFWSNNGCVKLKNAIAKCGKEVFIKRILYWCKNKTEANEVEQLLISLADSRHNGYNITPGGFGTGSGIDNPFYGKTHTEEVKQLLSKINTGRSTSEYQKQRVSETTRGRKISEETREKLRAVPRSDLCLQKISEANRNRVWSAESKAKLASAQSGRKMSSEARAKIAEANKRRVWTVESRRKLAMSKKKLVELR